MSPCFLSTSSSLSGMVQPMCLASCTSAHGEQHVWIRTSMIMDPLKFSFSRNLHLRTAAVFTPTQQSNPISMQSSSTLASAFFPMVKHGMQNVTMHSLGSEKHPNNPLLNSAIVAKGNVLWWSVNLEEKLNNYDRQWHSL